MRKQNDKKGFTIVELLLTCVLIGIVGLMITAFFVNWVQGYQITSARTDLLSDAENALDNITQNIRLSGAADQTNRWPDPNSPSGNFGWNAGATTLILAKAVTDNTGDVVFADPTNYVTEKYDEVFFVNNNVLYMRTIKSDNPNDSSVTTCPAPGNATCPADKVLANHVSNFQVKYFDPDENEVTPANARSVELTLGLKNTVYGSPVTANYTTRMVFRNE
jgi:type II secretory pathway pseudopilin PulG